MIRRYFRPNVNGTPRIEASLLFFSVLAFYLATLAPTVLWSDSAHLQRTAALGILDRDGGGRMAWYAAARLMLRLPMGDEAFRLNLFSAICSATAVAIIYLTALSAGLSKRGGVACAAALAVSHTFWQHAVRAEVYALFMALLALEAWLWFAWRPGRAAHIYAAAALLGPMLLAHQMTVLLMPALLFLCLARRSWLRPAQWVLVAVTTLATLTGAILALQHQMGTAPAQALITYLTHSGIDWRPALFAFTWTNLPADALMSIAFLVLQYPGPALLLGLVALAGLARKNFTESAWIALLILALTDYVFAFAYRVNDRYVFFMPLYLVFALLVGRGWDQVEARWPSARRYWAPMVVLLVCAPVASYATAATAAQHWGINPLQVRTLPFREPSRYFLWPALNGYDGAATFAHAALAAVPPGAVIVADYAPFEPLSYAQKIEGLREGAQIEQVEPYEDLAAVLARYPPYTPVFFADNDPRHYNFASLPGARLEPFGLIYRLQR